MDHLSSTGTCYRFFRDVLRVKLISFLKNVQYHMLLSYRATREIRLARQSNDASVGCKKLLIKKNLSSSCEFVCSSCVPVLKSNVQGCLMLLLETG